MADQDAQDINQMMSLAPEVAVKAPRKSMFGWIVLGCVVLGVGLGVVVYQRSLAPAVKPSPTPRAVVATPTPVPSPVATPVVPQTNVVTPVANTVTFPKKGKLRVYFDTDNFRIQLNIVIGGVKKSLILPEKSVSPSIPMNYADTTFEVDAGSVGTITGYLDNDSGPKMAGWIDAVDKKKCGANGFAVVDMGSKLDYVTTKLGTESIFAWQCWADDDVAEDPSQYDFNDVYMLWTYVTSATVAPPSPSPSALPSVSPSPSPSPSRSPSPSPSVAASPGPSAATVASPSPSARAAMPDTTDGVPVTGVFEVTVGTVSVGLILLVLGLTGLLAL